jgi:flagellar hook-associated protein 3 FlgL
MRVATSMVYSFIRSSLADITRDLNDASETVITGKRINTLSDDPMGMVNATGIKSTLKGLDQLERGLSLGKTWLTASESALTQAQNLVSEAKTLAIQMANSPISSSNRENAAIMVQHHLEQLVSLANTQVDDRYIFSGNHTDTPPFELDENGSIIREADGSIRYQGDNQPFAIKTEGGATLMIGGDGDAVFSQIFDTLARFKEALENDDLQEINTAMEALDSDFEDLNSRITAVGSNMSRLDMKFNIYQEMKINGTERLSAIEDADIIAAITHLEQMQLSYQAALSSSSKLMSISLLDYLK